MTEAEWLASRDPCLLIGYLGDGIGLRRAMLFSVACARHIWPLLQDDASRNAVGVAERFVDGSASLQELEEAGQILERAWDVESFDRSDSPSYRAGYRAAMTTLCATMTLGGRHGFSYHFAHEAARQSQQAVLHAAGKVDLEKVASPESDAAAAVQADLLRCIIGNPFAATPRFTPKWLTTRVLALAQRMYEERDFEQAPALARLLQDAGCDDAEVLGHLRGGGPHARGCHVVDSLLGRG